MKVVGSKLDGNRCPFLIPFLYDIQSLRTKFATYLKHSQNPCDKCADKHDASY